VATYDLRRFTRPQVLKSITPRYLLEFLAPHHEFLAGRGVELPADGDADSFDYDALAGFFMEPGSDAPRQLLEALFFIHEMANPVSMDALLEEAERLGISLDGRPDPTPADVAVQVWLRNSDVLERKHAEQFLSRPRSFEYFRMNGTQVPAFDPPTQRELKPLEQALDDWFEEKKRGRDCRVFVYPRDDAAWFLVRHGDPFKREGSLVDGEPSSVFYRPEKYDVLVYDPRLGEIRMNAATKGEKELYRQKFGLHLFGSEDFFLGEAKYTLELLRQDGERSVVCADVEGIEWVRLKEIHFLWGGAYREVEVRKAEDIFASLKQRNREMPRKPPIIRASFLIRFTNVKTPRTLTIRVGNVAQYTRDDDSAVVEEWLVKRRFIVTEDEDAYEQPGAPVAEA